MRVIRALRELGISSVAVYSEADRASLHVRMADEAVYIGPAPAADSYLRIDRILDAATCCGAEAIHPGYGFLSENAQFAAACETAGIKFIGPPSSSIRAMGSKTCARKLATEAGVPVLPGTVDVLESLEQARRAAAEMGYPILLKASAGGGGRGMRRVNSETELESSYRDASSEAERAFKSGELYIEKLILKPRHIEIQVLGDEHGHLIHLGERECSIQRRHQKVIEECPSPLLALHPEMRDRMGAAAVLAARSAAYTNAGTVEFLVDAACNFYFLEMNTRLQVEHPVTELVTGIDLVHWQIRIAAGERLTLKQEDIHWNGAALECRIYAEDPDNQFFPSPGRITHMERPTGPGIRLDSGVYPGWTVPIDYDPLLSKLAVWADHREGAIARMRRALAEYSIAGIKTNLSFFRDVLTDAAFRSGHLHTGFIDEYFERRTGDPEVEGELDQIAVVIAAFHSASKLNPVEPAGHSVSKWKTLGRVEQLR